MALTTAQKATVKAAILADPALNAQPNNSDGAFAIAAAFAVAPIVAAPWTGQRVQRVAYDSGVPNTTGEPTLQVYISAEADDNFLVSTMSDHFVVTVDAGDVNGA